MDNKKCFSCKERGPVVDSLKGKHLCYRCFASGKRLKEYSDNFSGRRVRSGVMLVDNVRKLSYS